MKVNYEIKTHQGQTYVDYTIVPFDSSKPYVELTREEVKTLTPDVMKQILTQKGVI